MPEIGRKRETAIRPRPESGPPEWHTSAVEGYKLRYLEPYTRFRGIEIPWEDVPSLEKVTEEIAKNSRSRKVVRLSAGQFGTPLDLYVKRYNFKTWYGPYLRAPRKSRAQEEFDLGWKLMELGIRTPRPVWLAEAAGRLSPYSMLATESIPESENLIERWKRLETEKERQDLMLAAARFVLMMHEKGFFHDDFKAGHVLVRPHSPSSPGEFFVIDLLGCAILKRISAYRRAKNLYQILRSFKPKHTNFDFTNEHRHLFLESYARGPERADYWSNWVKRIGRLKGRIV